MEGPWPLGSCSSYPHTELFSPSEATYTLNSSLPTSQSLTDFHTTTPKNYHPTTTVRQQKATPSSPHFHLFAAITTDTQHLLNALVQIKSMRTEFTDHYKQDFTLLALISIYKAKKKKKKYISYQLVITNSTHTHIPLAEHILFFFLSFPQLLARGGSKENLSIPGATQGDLEPTLHLFFLHLHQQRRDEILDSSCVPHP